MRTPILSLAALLLIVGCNRPPESTEADRPTPVEVLIVAPETVNETTELTAILDAYQAVDVIAQVGGTVE